MARCKSCGAEIVWVKTRSGKRMPLDARPTPNGNLEIDLADCVYFVTPDLNAAGKRYTSHFATCPNASEHRR